MPKPEEVIVKETPSKYIVENRVLSLRCLVYYIDFEGKFDSLSLKNIIQQLSPRKLVCFGIRFAFNLEIYSFVDVGSRIQRSDSLSG